MKKQRSCGAVIYRMDGDKILYLLLHYQSGHWGFVKGHVEGSESEKNTIIRETKEEAGISSLEFAEKFKEKIGYFFREGGELISKEVIYLLAKTREKDVKISYEHIGYEWDEFEKAIELIKFDNDKNVLKKADEFIKKNNPTFQKGLEDF